ncbi:nucleotidyltransferase [Methanosarcina sp. WWM596]|nr:nucleotidyltransferase [Methanosarcina sp. WWM596]AKB22906.1 nucleotidyltransferase [Methanosarcina sp. WH1]
MGGYLKQFFSLCVMEKPESDIDILVKFSETKGLLTLVRI